MNVKPLEKHHWVQIVDIHEKHFKDEFPLEDIFSEHILNRFVVTDESDKVITYGGIKLLFELFTVTDLDRPVRERVIALKTYLNKAITEARKREYEQVHCFATHPINGSQDNWIEMLEKVGFTKTKGPALYINL
jgi:hypothetical protein